MSTSDISINDTEILKAELPYLLFRVGKNIYALNSKFVRSIETLGEITEIAKAEPNVRGGVIYQKEFIYLLDMRKLFGLDTQLDEFERTAQPSQRIKDHENWVSVLEKSVKERTEFTLSKDPHKCAFGKWYYSFKTDNYVLKNQLRAVEAPHEAIHNTAKIVERLMKEDGQEAALAEIEKMKATHYKATLNILTNLSKIIEDNLRELFIVIDAADCTKGIIVDSIVGVEYLNSMTETPESMGYTKYVEFLGHRENDNTIIIVLSNEL